MITDHLEIIRLNEVVNSLKEQNQKLLIDKQELQEKFSLYSVVKSLKGKEKISFDDWVEDRNYTQIFDAMYIDSEDNIFNESDLYLKYYESE